MPTTAVAVNADHTKFPEDWLFRWRWGKGKKQAKRGSQGKAKAGSDEDIDDVTPKGKQFLSLVNPLHDAGVGWLMFSA